MDADRRSAALTGSFLFLGTVVGVIGLGVVLEPLLSASDAPALASVASASGSEGSS
jgi:hypothetical protein